MREFSKTEDLNQLINSQSVVLIQFGSDSCTPCAAVREKIDIRYLDHPELEAVYVDIEKFPAVAAQRGIFSVPSIQVYIKGQLSIEESAYFSLDEIFDKIERYLKLLD